VESLNLHPSSELSVFLAPLALFMFVSSITPGPNNLMLLSSGIRFGFGRTVPHMLGISGGLVLLLTVSYAGVGALLLAAPGLTGLMTAACCAYLVWLAAALLKNEDPAAKADAGAARPMSLYAAALFQFVNPKAWAMAVTACTIVAGMPVATPLKLLLLTLLSAAVNLPSVAVWALFGRSLRRWLHLGYARLAFNYSMSLLVLATALWMLLPLLSHGAAPQIDTRLSLGR
jgi:threonine/homoserine/homoserine lactone efflux protein